MKVAIQFAVFVFSILLSTCLGFAPPNEDKSPFNQQLPDCKKSFTKISKKTTEKAIVCPMFKDEEGFLSEWVAYYQMHGFDHIMLFNDGSTDNSLEELQPWIKSGFVTVKANWTVESLNVHPAFIKNDFKKAMTIKALLERECKLQAIKWGYSYFVSLDIDEYLLPHKTGVTIVDELHRWFNETGRSVYCIEKLNFQQTPHTLEPVNLLTIEAFHTRMTNPSKMNYYMSVAPKCAYRLWAPDFRANSSEFIATCCHFHGCQGHDFLAGSTFCTSLGKEEIWRLNGKGKPYHNYLAINHYSRSLEKFAIKGKTWTTASGETRPGETAAQASRSYDIPKFLSRNVGWQFDDTALRYSCQLREHLKAVTGEVPYMRPGLFWYRNAEFGKDVSDPDKRGRMGRPNAPGFKYNVPNPYHYFGADELDVKKLKGVRTEK